MDHPDRATYFLIAASCSWSYFELSGVKEHKEQAIEALESAVQMRIAPPSVRIQAAIRVSQYLAADSRRASRSLKLAVQLLPTLNPRYLSRRDQQNNVSQFSGLASIAASAALEADENPYDVLSLLEIGRGVMATLQLHIRSDISELERTHPEIGREFLELREQLDSVPNVLIAREDVFPSLEYRRTLSKKFDNLIDSIRLLEGFERFLLGPSEPELKDLSALGSIAVFNISEIRSDALIVTEQGVRNLPLPLLNVHDLGKYAITFLDAVKSTNVQTYSHRKNAVKDVLKWLWQCAVGPVLEVLRIKEIGYENAKRPRIWWVCGGLLSILPVHAAGVGSQNAIDIVTSSYTPTLKALVFARDRERRALNVTLQRALLVGMPTTPDCGNLSFVNQELHGIQEVIPKSIPTLVLRNPAKSQIIATFHQHEIVHLACHGTISVADPSQSSLLLDDWNHDPLKVSDLISLKAPTAQLAFLSACHSAASRDLRLLDEAIHMSSAFQLLGFPSVIGTLWQITDSNSPDVVKDVYRWMVEESSDKVEIKRSAAGLHRAIRSLREKTRQIPRFSRLVPDDPLIWAAYVHLGI